MIRKFIAGAIGCILLPAVAGLSLSWYRLLTELQMDPDGSQWVVRFLAGCMVWLLVFLCLGRPFRTYVLAHELTHLLAAWISGVPAGQLTLNRDGGSVTVSRSSIWIALAPYMIPFYTLLLLTLHVLISLWVDPALWRSWLPFALGVTWSFHISFTVYALAIGQSDIQPYGYLGALPLIAVTNLLLLCLGLCSINRTPAGEDIQKLVHDQQAVYERTFEEIFQTKNTIIPD